MKPFDLCERAGLEVKYYAYSDRVGPAHGHVIAGAGLNRGHRLGQTHFVEAKDVEALLANAPVVYGDTYQTEWTHLKQTAEGRALISSNFKESTHTARLVCIEPLVKESEERALLRELAVIDCKAQRSDIFAGHLSYGLADLIERAKKLLEKE